MSASDPKSSLFGLPLSLFLRFALPISLVPRLGYVFGSSSGPGLLETHCLRTKTEIICFSFPFPLIAPARLCRLPVSAVFGKVCGFNFHAFTTPVPSVVGFHVYPGRAYALLHLPYL